MSNRSQSAKLDDIIGNNNQIETEVPQGQF